MPELTVTSPYVHSRVDSNPYTMGIGHWAGPPYARVGFTPPVGDFGFGLSLIAAYIRIPMN